MFPLSRHARPSKGTLQSFAKLLCSADSNIAKFSGKTVFARSASTVSPAEAQRPVSTTTPNATATSATATANDDTQGGGGELFTAEHRAVRETLAQVIERHINPYVDEWEESGIFPAHQVFKKLGDAGLLGLTKPVEFGGMGLDYR